MEFLGTTAGRGAAAAVEGEGEEGRGELRLGLEIELDSGIDDAGVRNAEYSLL